MYRFLVFAAETKRGDDLNTHSKTHDTPERSINKHPNTPEEYHRQSTIHSSNLDGYQLKEKAKS